MVLLVGVVHNYCFIEPDGIYTPRPGPTGFTALDLNNIDVHRTKKNVVWHLLASYICAHSTGGKSDVKDGVLVCNLITYVVCLHFTFCSGIIPASSYSHPPPATSYPLHPPVFFTLPPSSPFRLPYCSTSTEVQLNLLLVQSA